VTAIHVRGKMLKFVVFTTTLLLLLVGGCSKSEDNTCKTFAAASGHFDECTWTTDQADELCVDLGYKRFWGGLGQTEDCDHSTTVYITEITCCTQ